VLGLTGRLRQRHRAEPAGSGSTATWPLNPSWRAWMVLSPVAPDVHSGADAVRWQSPGPGCCSSAPYGYLRPHWWGQTPVTYFASRSLVSAAVEPYIAPWRDVAVYASSFVGNDHVRVSASSYGVALLMCPVLVA
jgi:hypothetical protein